MITVLGSINVDLIGQVPRLPAPGETVLGNHFMAAPGGKGANQALAAARAGAAVRMIGATGADPYADQALTLLKRDGVDLSAIHRAEVATGTAFVIVDDYGENQIAVMSGANLALTADMVGDLAFSQGDVLVLQLEIPLATMTPCITRAKQSGCIVMLNLAPFTTECLPLARQADIVVVNEGECQALGAALELKLGSAPGSVLEVATGAQSALGNTVVLTLGAQGALAITPTQTLNAPALNINPIDTVGAGDTFCGYLAATLFDSKGKLTQAALTQATKAASIACLKTGAQTAMPYRADLND
ncbi:MAG: ribokinase [Burkholderiaceae bacterium]